MRFFLAILFTITYVEFSGQTPIASYSFDNTTKDKSGNNNNGIIHGNILPVMDRFGNPCGAYHFDGNSYVEVPSSSSLESPTRAISVTLWYRFEYKRENYWLTAICKGVTNYETRENPQYRLQVQQNITPQVNTCSNGLATGSSTISLSTDFTECDQDFQNHLFEPYSWNFYALVFDGQKVKTYMNGTKVFEFDFSLSLSKNKSPLYIGMDEPGSSEYFEGSLDDLNIYDRALSDQELTSLLNVNRPTNWLNEEFEMPFIQNKVINVNGSGCDAKVDFDTPKIAKGSCGNITVRQIFGSSSGSRFPVGKHLISFQATSESGYEQHSSFYILIKDVTPPNLTLPGDTIILVRKGEGGTTFNYANPQASDNCGIRELELESGISSGNFLGIGKHQIAYKAIDINGNSTTKRFTIEVKEENAISVDSSTVKRIMTSAVVVTTAVDRKDLNITKNTTATYLPLDFKDRVVEEQRFIEVSSAVLKATIYDNGVYDGDTVSIFLNSGVLVSQQEVSIKGFSFDIKIDTTIDNELSMYAENLGSIPPNTALLIIFDGKERHEINLLSTLSKNGTIRIRKKK
jgi:hypothetical protein